MNQPDLTPAKFNERVNAQAALKFWLTPIVACAILASVLIVLEGARPTDTSGQLARERMEQAHNRIESSQSQIEAQAALLAQRERELQAEKHLTLRPDWSGVIGLIAQQFDTKLMMTGCGLADANDAQVRNVLGEQLDEVPEGSVWMIVSGVAESNSDVPGLIVRLEALGLFERVVMATSQRERFANGSRTIFTLACRVQ